MSASLNAMLSSIKNLQVVVHLCLLQVVVPAVSDMFFLALFDIIAFDPVDVEDIRKWFGFGFVYPERELEEEDAEIGADPTTQRK